MKLVSTYREHKFHFKIIELKKKILSLIKVFPGRERKQINLYIPLLAEVEGLQPSLKRRYNILRGKRDVLFLDEKRAFLMTGGARNIVFRG